MQGLQLVGTCSEKRLGSTPRFKTTRNVYVSLKKFKLCNTEYHFPFSLSFSSSQPASQQPIRQELRPVAVLRRWVPGSRCPASRRSILSSGQVSPCRPRGSAHPWAWRAGRAGWAGSPGAGARNRVLEVIASPQTVQSMDGRLVGEARRGELRARLFPRRRREPCALCPPFRALGSQVGEDGRVRDPGIRTAQQTC